MAADTFLAEATIDPEQVRLEPDSRIEDQKIVRLCEILQSNGNNALLGFHIGSQTTIGNWGLVGYLMKYAPNLDASYQYLEKYVSLILENRKVRYWHQGNEAFCEMQAPLNTIDVQLMWQTYASGLLRLLELVSGKAIAPKWLAFPRGGTILTGKELSLCMNSEVILNDYKITLCLNKADVLKPNPSADRYLETIFLNQAHAQFEQLQLRRFTHEEQVRNCLALELVGGQLNITNVANRLGISERSLQRRLATEGYSFSKIVDDFRAENARRLLLNQNFTVAQVAEILGYQTTSSFHRAFNRWHSTSPKYYIENCVE